MGGVNADDLEHAARVDIPCMEQCVNRICRIHPSACKRRSRRIVERGWGGSYLGTMAEKSLGGENVDRDRSQLHGLVLVRTAFLPKSATKYLVCCYSKSGSDDHHPACREITIERGT